jgi:hypothetical protein
MFGDGYAFVDHTHDSRGLAPRSFGSFLGGRGRGRDLPPLRRDPLPAAIVNGIAQGGAIGRAVTALPLRD